MMTGSKAEGRRSILDQAHHLFFAHGYHGVSIRDIVQACGLSNAALYYHFGSKQNLFVEVIREFAGLATQRLQDAGSGGGTCRERLARMVEAYARFVGESQTELQTMLRDLTGMHGEEIQRLLPEVHEQIPSLFAAVLEEGIAAGEVRPLDAGRTSWLLLGMINSLAARRMQEMTLETLTEDIDLVISTLFEGIGA